MALSGLSMLRGLSGLGVVGGGVNSARNFGTLIAEYRFTEASGTTLIDYSGLGNNGTLTGSPTLNGWGITTAANKYADAPSGTANPKTTILAFVPSAAGFGRVLSGVSSGGKYLARLPPQGENGGNAYPDSICPFMTGTTPSTYANYPSFPAIVTNTFASTAKMYLEGELVPTAGYISGGDSSAGLWTGGIRFGGHDNAAACEANTYCYCLLYSDVLSDANVLAASQYIRAKLNARSIPTQTAGPDQQTTNVLFLCGNSLITNMTATSITPTGTWHLRKYARGSMNTTQVDQFAVWSACKSFRPLASKNVCLVWNGINRNYSATMTTVDNIKAARPTMKVLVMSSLSNSGAGDANMALDNADYTNSIGNADAYVDLAADPSAGPALCTAGAYSNTTYFSDGIHPTAAGNALIYPVITAAVDALP